MPTSMSIASLILLALVLTVSSTYGQDVGDACTINDPGSSPTPGVCKILTDCPVVYRELLSGKLPSTNCGYINFDPVVCCPNETKKPTVVIDRMTEAPPPPLSDKNRVARAKCVENAQATYGLELSPVLTYDRPLVNVSRCENWKVKKLIVGGKRAEPKEFPHMAAIGFDGRQQGILWLCGGSLISDRIVLTAAHCTFQIEWKAAKWVRLGDLNLVSTDDDADPQTIKIAERIRHPDYKRPSQYHDIAILKLESSVVYNAYVRPACLPVDWPDVGADNKVAATGWGRVDWDENSSNDLLKVTLETVEHQTCHEKFSGSTDRTQLASGIVDEWQMCAGAEGKDTCQGDSGGPLSVFNEDHECMYNVVGVTSFGKYCGSIIPGVYTRVYHYIPWIERTAWPELVSKLD